MRLHLDVSTTKSVEVWFAGGHAVLTRYAERYASDTEYEYVPGLRAAIDGDTLVLRFPAKALPAPKRPSRWSVLSEAPHPYAYALEDWVPDGASSRTLRPGH